MPSPSMVRFGVDGGKSGCPWRQFGVPTPRVPPHQIEYFSNEPIVELVEQPHRGILALLDEACLAVGTVTDPLFLASMDARLGRHPHYTSRKVLLGGSGRAGGVCGQGADTPLLPSSAPQIRPWSSTGTSASSTTLEMSREGVLGGCGGTTVGCGCHWVAMGLWGTVRDLQRAWRTVGGYLAPWGYRGS